MSAHYSTAQNSYEYRPTLIEHRLLIHRLATQLVFLTNEIKNDPRRFAAILFRDLLPTPKAILVLLGATAVVLLVALTLKKVEPVFGPADAEGQGVEDVVMLPLPPPPNADMSFGNGSRPAVRRSDGGGSGGNHDRIAPQRGKVPPSSSIPAAIPIAPPVHAQALPVAGVNIDPAMWQDVKGPVYGDPRSSSTIPSKGPGEGEGIGTRRGTGIGDGVGPGIGPGTNGNWASDGGPGCGGGNTGCTGYRSSEVDQRARLLQKPEPHYTEEARSNQITGRVILRAVFASSGEVVQIEALTTLPFGLTEQAIAAARQIKFLPAMKRGRPVSVYMKLEYNFNLY